MQKNKNKIISSAIILSLIIAPIFYAQRVQAQQKYNGGISVNTGSTVNTGTSVILGGGNGGNYKGNVLPTMMKLPGCQKMIKDGVKGIFKMFSGNKPTSGDFGSGKMTSGFGGYGNTSTGFSSGSGLDSALFKTKSKMDSVQTFDETLNMELKVNNTLSKTIAESTQNTDYAVTCLNPVGKILANKFLQEMTLSTVEWIKTGNGGKPYFLQDGNTFFKDIAKNEMLTFSAEISDPVRYPYGKNFLQNMAQSYNQRFQDNARYSLNEMISKTTPEYSAITFQNDFSQGGWNAWDAMTQVPANNPLGFQMIASEELGKRLAGTNQSNAQDMRDALIQGGGFLGDQKCVDPKTGRLNGITKEEDANARKERATFFEDKENAQKKYDAWIAGGRVGLVPINPSTMVGQNLISGSKICEKWIYVTPGQTIADMATKAIGYPDQALIDAETLNDALAAIIDAVGAKFSNDIMQKGLANTSTNNDYYQNNKNYFNQSGTSDFSEGQINASNWLQQNYDFDIRTDLDQGLIDTQRTYIEKLNQENKALNDLVKSIWQLDYCIPGPNPNWEENSSNAMESIFNGEAPTSELSTLIKVNNAVNGTLGTMAQNMIQDVVSEKLKSVSKVLSSIPVLPILGAILSVISENEAFKDNQKNIASYVATILAVWVNGDDMGGVAGLGYNGGLQTDLQNIDDANNFLRKTFYGYSALIKATYFTASDASDKFMPQVTGEARKEFSKVEGLQQMILDNGETITSVKSVVNRLNDIKNQVDELNDKLNNGLINQDDYEYELKPIINSFARMSNSIYTGDDISSADNIYKEALDEKDYVENTLLLGNYGCEAFLANLWKTDKVTYSKYVRRQPYILPIDHLYLPYVTSIALNKNPHEEANWLKPWSIGHVNNIRATIALTNEFKKNNGAEGFLYGVMYRNEMNADSYLGKDALSCGTDFISFLDTPKLNGLESISRLRTEAGGDHENRYMRVASVVPGTSWKKGQTPGGVNECGVVNRGLERMFNVY